MDQKKIKERSHNENRFLTNYIKGNNSIKCEKRKNASIEYKNLKTEIFTKSQSTLLVKIQNQNQNQIFSSKIKFFEKFYRAKVSVRVDLKNFIKAFRVFYIFVTLNSISAYDLFFKYITTIVHICK